MPPEHRKAAPSGASTPESQTRFLCCLRTGPHPVAARRRTRSDIEKGTELHRELS